MIVIATVLVVVVLAGVLGSGYLAVYRIRRGGDRIAAIASQSRQAFRRELANETLSSLADSIRTEAAAHGWDVTLPNGPLSEQGLLAAIEALAATLPADQQAAFDEIGGLGDVAAALALRPPRPTPDPGDPWTPPA